MKPETEINTSLSDLKIKKVEGVEKFLSLRAKEVYSNQIAPEYDESISDTNSKLRYMQNVVKYRHNIINDENKKMESGIEWLANKFNTVVEDGLVNSILCPMCYLDLTAKPLDVIMSNEPITYQDGNERKRLLCLWIELKDEFSHLTTKDLQEKYILK